MIDWAQAVFGGGSLGSSAGSSVAGGLGALGQMLFSSKQAQKQMAFQDYMSSTAHRREMLDLIRAGLNPILTATGGPGAPGGAGAMAQGADVAASAMEARRKALENDVLHEDKWRVRAQGWAAKAQELLTREQTETQKYITQRTKEEASIAASTAKGMTLEGQIDETKYGEVFRYIDRAVRSLTGGSSAYRNMFQQR